MTPVVGDVDRSGEDSKGIRGTYVHPDKPANILRTNIWISMIFCTGLHPLKISVTDEVYADRIRDKSGSPTILNPTLDCELGKPHNTSNKDVPKPANIRDEWSEKVIVSTLSL